jgi:hypothetical protein
MTQRQIEARRKGGYSLQNKYDAETKREWCRRGGRPRNRTLLEIRAMEALN